MNKDENSMEIELDGYSTSSSSSYGDFGDTKSADEVNSSAAALINIKEKSSSSEEEDLPDEEHNHPFPPTNLVLRLSSTLRHEAISFLVKKITATKRLGGAELLLRCEPFFGPREIVLHVTATSLRFLEVAEFLELKKEDERGLLREFRVRDLDNFLHGDILLGTLITPAEKELIVLHELSNIRALPGEPCIPGYPALTLHSGQSIFQLYVKHELIISYYPLHDVEQLTQLLRTNWLWSFWSPEPFELLRRYFGEGVTLYFTFSAFYTACLVPLALIIVVLTMIPESVLSANTRISVACILNLFWVTFLLKKWRRKCAELAYSWGTFKLSKWEEPRPNYTGRMSVDPVTGQYQPKSPWWKTGVKVYLVSTPLVIVCMGAAFVVMVYYFKLEEALNPMKEKYKGQLPGFLANISASTAYAILVAAMTTYYRKFADVLTEWENHRTQGQWERHRTAKLVAFEFVNNFMSFIYIAFMLKDLDMLKNQLVTMLIVMHLIVVVQEAIIPLFIRTTATKVQQFLDAHDPSVVTFDILFNQPHPPSRPRRSPSLLARSLYGPATFGLIPLAREDPRIEMNKVEGKMVPYKGSFDDYLQLFIQFGYVFLFSPTFPLAVLIAVCANVFLIWANVFKLCKVFQRPIPKRVKDIGTWQVAFELMGVLSVMTNCALIALSSGLKDTRFKGWTDDQFYFLIIICEHLIVGVKLGVNRIIPNIPYWVKIAVARMDYRATMAFKREQHLRTRRRLSMRYRVINMGLRDQNRDHPESRRSMRSHW